MVESVRKARMQQSPMQTTRQSSTVRASTPFRNGNHENRGAARSVSHLVERRTSLTPLIYGNTVSTASNADTRFISVRANSNDEHRKVAAQRRALVVARAFFCHINRWKKLVGVRRTLNIEKANVSYSFVTDLRRHRWQQPRRQMSTGRPQRHGHPQALYTLYGKMIPSGPSARAMGLLLRRIPWFKDKFDPSTEHKPVYMGEPLTHCFGGFFDRKAVARE
jgi:hypothetical protein